jgi:hypothetical protein
MAHPSLVAAQAHGRPPDHAPEAAPPTAHRPAGRSHPKRVGDRGEAAPHGRVEPFVGHEPPDRIPVERLAFQNPRHVGKAQEPTERVLVEVEQEVDEGQLRVEYPDLRPVGQAERHGTSPQPLGMSAGGRELEQLDVEVHGDPFDLQVEGAAHAPVEHLLVAVAQGVTRLQLVEHVAHSVEVCRREEQIQVPTWTFADPVVPPRLRGHAL